MPETLVGALIQGHHHLNIFYSQSNTYHSRIDLARSPGFGQIDLPIMDVGFGGSHLGAFSQLGTKYADVSVNFSGFNYPGLNIHRRKEADTFLTSIKQPFPLIVLESGWSEWEKELIHDAQLWLHETQQAV